MAKQEMPYELPLPNAFKQWTVKIFDNELPFEEPHVTIIFKQARWRWGLRREDFLEDNPNPKDVPAGILDELAGNLEQLRKEWNTRFPNNRVHEKEEE
jgi:hypothetical protein